MPTSTDIPLVSSFPALGNVPRVPLCILPSPVERIQGDDAVLWIKRDDLNAEVCGGNKARTLEWLLGRVRRGDHVLTLGGEGSTHVLATAVHAARIGALTIALRWRHEVNPTANRIAALSEVYCERSPVYATAIGAIVRAALRRMRHRGTSLHYIPLGGSVPVGVLAHVNAALELAVQIEAGALPMPQRVVVPLGSGGTMAGLVLGFALARLDLPVIGVQVTPLIVANQVNVLHLAAGAGALIEKVTGERVPRPDASLLQIVRSVYGGAYGREVPAAREAAEWLARVGGIALDQTYSAKAFAVALALAREESRAGGRRRPTLFWNTFDGRLLA